MAVHVQGQLSFGQICSEGGFVAMIAAEEDGSRLLT